MQIMLELYGMSKRWKLKTLSKTNWEKIIICRGLSFLKTITMIIIDLKLQTKDNFQKVHELTKIKFFQEKCLKISRIFLQSTLGKIQLLQIWWGQRKQMIYGNDFKAQITLQFRTSEQNSIVKFELNNNQNLHHDL